MKKTDSILNTSVEDLLKIAEINSPKQEPSTSVSIPVDLDPVYSYLLNFKIEPGKNKVSDAVLYELFTKWKPSFGMSKQAFNLHLSKYIQPAVSRDRKYYLINLKGIKVKEETLKYLIEKGKHKKNRNKNLKKHFEHFMNRYSIEEGTDSDHVWIEGHILYFYYNRWHYERTKAIEIGQVTFYSLTRLYLPQKVVKRGNIELIYFKVKKKFVSNVSQQSIDNLREGWKKKSHGNKKRKIEVSQSGTEAEFEE